MKKLTLVMGLAAVLATAQMGVAAARGGDQTERGNSARGPAVTESGQRGGRDSTGGRRRGGGAEAQETRPARFADRVDSRQARQHDRIHEGRADGTLTRGETRQLRRDQKEISRLERRFGHDGRIDKRERRILNDAQDRASRRIYRAKHNDFNRGHRGWREQRHPGHGHYQKWWRHGHRAHVRLHQEEQVAYSPSSSSTLALDLQFENFSVGLSRSTQF